MTEDYTTLLKKLNSFIKEYYKNRITRGIIYSFTSLISVLILLLLTEYFGFFNTIVRSFFFWGYLLIVLCIVGWFILIPTFKMLKFGGLSHEELSLIHI